MHDTRMMIRFLDLTLILLMAFLLQADLAIERDVGLPHGSEEAGAGKEETLRIRLALQSWTISAGNRRLCGGERALQLQECLQSNTSEDTSVLVTPEEGVRVQRLVDVLDVCASIGVRCSASY